MSTHIGARPGEIAETVLLPGDPLRADWIANKLLKDAVCYNRVRNMFGFTGEYNQRQVSVMGSGMGQPSLSIYVNELVRDFGVKRIIRVGTAGSLQSDLKCGDIVLAMSASTDSGMQEGRFRNLRFAPTADWQLLRGAEQYAHNRRIPVRIGNVFASDFFYNEAEEMETSHDAKAWKKLARYGTLAIEMETAELYTLAAFHKVQALSILTISDEMWTDTKMNATERQRGLEKAAKMALSL